MIAFFKSKSIKFLKVIFSVKTLGLIILTILLLPNFLISAALAQTTTTTVASANPENIESATAPCSIFDYDWGTTSSSEVNVAGSLGQSGLYKSLGQGGVGFGVYGMDSSQKDAYRNLVASLGKDPLLLGGAENGNYYAQDPILGAFTSSGRNLDGKTAIKQLKNEVILPCMVGQVKGILPKNGWYTQSITIPAPGMPYPLYQTDVYYNSKFHYSNCNYGPMAYCDEDVRLANGVSGGCSLDFEFEGNHNIAYVASLGQSGRADKASEKSALRVVYSPGTVLRKTNFNTNVTIPEQTANFKIDDEFKQTRDAFDDYYTNIVVKGGSAYNSNLTSLKFADQKNAPKDIKIPYKDDSGVLQYVNKSRFWANTISNAYYGYWPKLTTNNNGVLEESIYLINSDVLPYTKYTSFVCNKVTYDVPDPTVLIKAPAVSANPLDNFMTWYNYTFGSSSQKISSVKVNIYQWEPSSLLQYSSPSCETLGANASRVIELPSAIIGSDGKSKKYLACTPCALPRLFQTDMFGQPVLGIITGIGCLPSSIEGNITVLMRIGTMTAGGIAVIIIVLAGVNMAINSSNPDEIRKSQKRITSAVVGLLVIISSMFLLNVIGFKLLDLSVFGGGQVEFVITGKTSSITTGTTTTI